MVDRPMTTDPRAALDRLAASRFRGSFELFGRERDQLRRDGIERVMRHARVLLEERLAPARPPRDGRQTPWRGHPVFIAQHATATCCRSCLERWHGMSRDVPLSDEQLDRALALIRGWLELQVGDEHGTRPPPSGLTRQLDLLED